MKGFETPRLNRFVPMPPIKEAKEETENLSLEELAKEIIERGYDMEVRSGKDGMKVYEVKKRLVCIIPVQQGADAL